MNKLAGFALLLLATALSLLVEQNPDVPSWLPGGEWVLLPVLLVSAAFLMPPALLWLLAFLGGLLTDLVSPPRLGSTSLIALVCTAALQAAELQRFRYNWMVHALAALGTTFVFQLLYFVSFCLHQGRFMLPDRLWEQTFAASLFNAVLAPVFIGLWNLVSTWHDARRSAPRRRHAR